MRLDRRDAGAAPLHYNAHNAMDRGGDRDDRLGALLRILVLQFLWISVLISYAIFRMEDMVALTGGELRRGDQ